MTPFTTIVADPPWQYSDQLTMFATKRGAAANYPTLSVQEICDLYEPSVISPQRRRPGLLAGHPIADVAFCGLWATKDILLEGIAVRVLNAWGFAPKQIVPWVKGRIDKRLVGDNGDEFRQATWDVEAALVLQMGMGRIFRNCVEYLVIGVRGEGYSKLLLSKASNGLVLAEEDSVILAPRTRHSTKPEASYQLIERTLPGPYLELFARKARPGWTCWGNELLPDRSSAPFSVTMSCDGEEIDVCLDSPIVHPDTVIEWP